MKRIILFLTFLSGIISTCACSDDDINVKSTENSVSEQSTNQIVITNDELILLKEASFNSTKISREEAIEIANSCLFEDNNSLKKSFVEPSCEVITQKKKSISKSSNQEEFVDTLMYVLNYGENNGFAVINADFRAEESIMAFANKGELNLSNDNSGVKMFMDLAELYLAEQIEEFESKRDSIENSLEEKLNLKSNSLSKAKVLIGRTEIPNYRVNTKITLTDTINPLIQTEWHQNSPFNNQIEICTTHNIHKVTGCDCIATCQLIAYHKYPQSINGHYFNWNKILQIKDTSNNYFKAEVSLLTKYIGAAINTIYKCDTTIKCNSISEYHTSTSNCYNSITYLKKVGYKTNGIQDYTYTAVIQSIKNKKPVLTRGSNILQKIINGEKVVDTLGHAWLIDGYIKEHYDKEETRIVIKIYDDNGRIVQDAPEYVIYTSNYNKHYFHCNWGWGHSNGYFLSDAFDLNRRFKISNNKMELVNSNDNTHYNIKLQIATNIYH